MRAIVRVARHRDITPRDCEYIHTKPRVGDVARLVVATARGQPDCAGVARIVHVSPEGDFITVDGMLPAGEPGEQSMDFIAPAAFRDVNQFLAATSGEVLPSARLCELERKHMTVAARTRLHTVR
ncbi:hypothetical protein [Parafrankia sp. EUN1f]|uniref:hypothetical protein n=1 Tax=Parafrankia sp. EUN1f TaxID=102897 RepID=UPI0001C4530D|nr:hypothetical protein [Parafrankia sp. EUN1f]EFC78975.1 hypothetical protein FrEUN1fDRAFT_7902 [Parafrankia sp. EUN1f]EFC80221.1 hypothetical protein FrEUN1fDRAFT_6653 [Parafrankia sp. EUN1f]